MNKADFENCYAKSCFLENEENDELRKAIQNHKQAIQKVCFKNQTLRWTTSTIKQLREDIKNILIERQKNGYGFPTCPYCRQAIREKDGKEGGAGVIDHILPKSKYINLIFSPYNLILACENCNSILAKGNRDLLDDTVLFDEDIFIKLDNREENIQLYSNNQEVFFNKIISSCTLKPRSGTYLWVHPYYDEYFDCIKIVAYGNTLLYSANENASDEQQRKAIKMITELGLYKGERNVTTTQVGLTAISDSHIPTISDLE